MNLFIMITVSLSLICLFAIVGSIAKISTALIELVETLKKGKPSDTDEKT